MEILRSEWGGSLAEVTQLGGRQAKTEPCLILAFSAIFCCRAFQDSNHVQVPWVINSSSCRLPVPWPDSFHDALCACACVYVCVCERSLAQLCPTLCDPMVCSPPGSSVHGDSPGKNTGVGCHSVLQGIFLTQEWNLGLLLCSWILYWLSHQESPSMMP